MKLVYFISLLSLHLIIFAQAQLRKRIEIEAEHRNHFQFSTYYQHGAIIRFEEKKTIKYVVYDNKLSIDNEYSVTNISKNDRRGTFSDSLSHTDYFLKYPTGECKIVKVNIQNKVWKEYQISLPRYAAIHDFIVLKNSIYFALYFKNGDKKILSYQFETKEYKQLDISKFNQIDDLIFNTLNQSEALLFIKHNKSNDVTFYSLNDNEPGLKNENKLNYKGNKCIDLTATKLHNTIYISSLYSIDNNMSSEGIQLNTFNLSIKTSSHTTLPLSELRTLKTSNRDDKIASYNLQQHPLRTHNGSIYWMGEFYEPGYRKNTKSAFINGKQISPTKSSRSFEGYQYTQATLLAWDTLCTFKYENTFHLFPSTTPLYLHQWLSLDFVNDTSDLIKFSSIDRSKIEVYSVLNGALLKNNYRHSFLAQTKDDDDEVQFTTKGLSSFIENKMLVFGFQKITNRNEIKGLKARKVYFINVYE